MRLCKCILAAIICFAMLIFTAFASNEGLIVGYNFDTSGLITDISGNGMNGTAYNTQWEEGSISFIRGNTSYIDLGSGFVQSLNSAGAITISLWFKHGGAPVDSDYLFYASNGGKAALEVYITSTSLRICGRSNSDDTRWDKKYPAVENDRWYHLTAIWDFQNKKILGYLNGTKMTHEGGSDSATFINNSFAVSGTSNRSSISTRDLFKEFNGSIDEVKIYNRALTNSEIVGLTTTKTISTEPTNAQITAQLQSSLQGSLVMAANSNDTFANGIRTRIDWSNKNITPFISDGKFYAPAQYVADFFGQTIQTNGSIELYGKKYLEISELANRLGKAHTIYNDLAMLGNNIDTSILSLAKSRLLSMPYTPLENNYRVGSSAIATKNTVGLYLGSPSIVKLPSGALLASHDYFGSQNSMTEVLYKSLDNGATWQKQSEVQNCTWATLFEHSGSIYLMGVSEVFGSIIIYKSTDEGTTWSQGAELFSADGKYHTAPVPIVKHNGRIFRSYESGLAGGTASDFTAFVISASENSNLMLPQSWSKSNELVLDKSLISTWKYANAGWLEGNVVVSPEGEIWNVMRTTIPPNSDKVALLKLDPSTMTLRQDSNDAYLSMPGGSHKFSIKYDEISKKYISIVNNNTDSQYFNQRNVLSLIYSDDLRNWTVAQTLIGDNSMMSWDESVQKIGYQYVDYIIDGNDLKLVVRQASNGAANYHDSNQIVFYKVSDFRNYLNNAKPLASWDFESVNGSIINGNGFDGTLSNQNITISSGYKGNGANIGLGSSNTYLGVIGLAKALNNRTSYTVGMWVQLKSLPQSGQGNYQLFKICIDGSTGGAMAYLNGDGKMVFEARGKLGETLKRVTADTAFLVDSWHHIAFVVDYKAKHMGYYLDGKLEKWTNVAAFDYNTLQIGVPAAIDTMFGGAGSGVFNGKIDEIIVYPTRLSGEQIKQMLQTKAKLYDSTGKESMLKNGSMSMKVEINQSISKEQSFICAVYDKDTGRLLSVGKDDRQMIKGVPQTFECIVAIPEKFYDRRIKAFLWDKNLVPWGDGGILYEGE